MAAAALQQELSRAPPDLAASSQHPDLSWAQHQGGALIIVFKILVCGAGVASDVEGEERL